MGDTTTDLLATLSTPDSSTGIPILLEIGLALLGGLFLASWVGGVSHSYKRGRKKRTAVRARRAALKAELAAL